MRHEGEFYYLVELQYLGFRFHGWQKQPKVKTVQGTIERTLRFIFEHDIFKTLAAGRTDAMVSANQTYFHLTTRTDYQTDWLLTQLNKNLPQDVNIIDIKTVNSDFNILEQAKLKEYHYLFSHGERNHPFSASLITGKMNFLDIDLMQQGAKLFEGFHNFKKYTVRSENKINFEREIISSEIVENEIYTASFFPEKSFIYKVVGTGFMRYQIRMMMGSLFRLGTGEINLNDLKKTLHNWDDEELLTEIAPASGLTLYKTN